MEYASFGMKALTDISIQHVINITHFYITFSFTVLKYSNLSFFYEFEAPQGV